jgi:hypothetical protein
LKDSSCFKKSENYTIEQTQLDIDESPQVDTDDIFENPDEILLNEDDTFASSPGFASGPGTIGFGRVGSSLGN